LVWNFE